MSELANMNRALGELPEGTRIRIGNMIVTIKGQESFGTVRHYAVLTEYALGTFEHAWFPCRVLDALHNAARERRVVQVPVSIPE